MARQNRPFRSGRNPSNSFVEAAAHVSDALGPKWTILLIIVVVIGVIGGINALFNRASDVEAAEINAAEILSKRPDGVESGCFNKLVKSGLAETTVERYERQQLEARIKSGYSCTP